VTSRTYIPQLDGLRALAVMLVVAYHMTAPFIVGGFIGVWMFFVLSGFLITSLLIGDLERHGSIGLRRFYFRRAIRLYPALVIGVVVAVVVAALADRQTAETIASATFALTYLTNVQHWFGETHHGLLDHTWSLAVEAQFYFVWPFIVAALFRVRRLAAGSLALAAGCLALSLVQNRMAATWPTNLPLPSFHTLPLLLGAWLASAESVRRWPAATTTAATWLGLATIVVIALTARASGDRWLLDWGYPLLAVATAAVIAGLSRGDVPLLSWLFGWSLAVWIGQRSYGIYLYHYGISLTLLDVRTFIRVPLVIGLTFVIAELSWRFVERPLLRRGRGIRGHVETTEPSLVPARS
jgi:peptidoglycan/LPS O-acetylase OafA/YrhL